MKKRCTGMAVVLALLVAFGIGRAQPTDFHGVLDPHGTNKGAVIDSVTVVPPDTTFRTANWMTDGQKVDTFDFPDLPGWPTDLWVYGVVAGVAAQAHIAGPVGGQWYPFGMGTAVPNVMFYGAGGGAVEESRPAIGPQQCLNVSPSVVTGQMTVRLQPVGPGRAVVDIHDAVGNVVRSLDCTAGANGLAVATWNREDGFGRFVPEGVYFCRYAAAGVVAVRKVLVTH
jgi:hypothetical protein